MAKLKIGKLPVYKGEYQNDINYSRLNQVSYLGTTFQSLTDDNIGHPPAELSVDDGEITFINTNYWNIIAKGLEYNDNRIATDNNKGYKILKKNKSFAEQVTEENTIYEIRYNFTLTGDVTIPENCVLKFNGGSIDGDGTYTLTGQNSSYVGKNNLFKNILLTGTWNVPIINDFVFDESSYSTTLNLVKSINALQNENIFNEIIINRDYIIDFDVATYGQYIVGTGFIIKSNARVYVAGTLTAVTNNYTNYSIFQLSGKNIEYSGGTLVGDVRTHTGSAGEFGFGISLHNTKYTVVHDVICKEFWGDGIVLKGTETEEYTANKCEYVYIYNVICDSNRRQGLSICAGHDIIIENSKFINTGQIAYTSPGRGIDIEPNDDNSHKDVVDGVVIRNCYFSNNYNGSIIVQSQQIIYNKNILIDNCEFNNTAVQLSGVDNIRVRDCKNTGVTFANLSADIAQTAYFEHCIVTKGCYTEGNAGKFNLYISDCDWSGTNTKRYYLIEDNIIAKNTKFSSSFSSVDWHITAENCDMGNYGDAVINGTFHLNNCKFACYKIKPLGGSIKFYNCYIDFTNTNGFMSLYSSDTTANLIDLRNNIFSREVDIIHWQITDNWNNCTFIIYQTGVSAQFSTINGSGFDEHFASVTKRLLTWQ